MHGDGNSSGSNDGTKKGSLGDQIATEHWWRRP